MREKEKRQIKYKKKNMSRAYHMNGEVEREGGRWGDGERERGAKG
jgi:hypothetical protein